MSRDLDTQFSQLLEAIAERENATVEMLGKTFASNEIKNRRTFYPQLRQVLLEQELDIDEFKGVIRNCWAATAKIEFIRFTRFTEKGQPATQAIQTLIEDFPQDDAKAAVRIDAFIDSAVRLAYKDKNDSPDRAGAAALCSVLLTSLFPDRFVDFKQRRWKKFARTLDYDIPYPSGEGVWSGHLVGRKFRGKCCGDHVFQESMEGRVPLVGARGDCLDIARLEPDP